MQPPHVTRSASPANSRGSRLGERLRQLRVSAGLTQSDVAGDRFSKEYVSQIERGKTRPTQETVDWLAGRLGVDPSFLASGVSTDERARVEATLARAESLTEAREFEQALEEFDRAAAAVRAAGSPELEARMLTGKGWALHQSGQVREALPIFTHVRELVEDPSFTDLARADVLFRLGACRYVLSSIAMAVSLLDEALKLAERSDEPSDLLQARVLAWRSRCRRRQRDWEAAREDVERALELAEGLNDTHALAHINLQASLIAERNGQWVRSRSYAERARHLFEELADRRSVGLMLNNLGGLQYLLGKPEDAVKHLTEASHSISATTSRRRAPCRRSPRCTSAPASPRSRKRRRARRSSSCTRARTRPRIAEAPSSCSAARYSTRAGSTMPPSRWTRPNRCSHNFLPPATSHPHGSPRAISRRHAATTQVPPSCTGARRKRSRIIASRPGKGVTTCTK
jgi:transcriptional regulator with XRE-family HTH domain